VQVDAQNVAKHNLRGLGSIANPASDDDRAMRAKALQMEQARALEAQVEANKSRQLEEKRKIDEEERREEERLNRERLDLQAAYDREKNFQKVQFSHRHYCPIVNNQFNKGSSGRRS